MGSSKKQTVGYHYKYLLHYGICRGPIDAFLEFRAGDRTAWSGKLEESGTISINAPNLWGGEKSEGGVVGDADIMFGEADQMPNAWLIANQGPEQSGYRGKFGFLYKGGRFGINPYPKSVAFHFRRILKGWDNDDCWYPETAAIIVAGADTGHRIMALTSMSGQSTPSGASWQSGIVPGISGRQRGIGLPDRFIRYGSSQLEYSTDGVAWTTSADGLGGTSRACVVFKGQLVISGGLYGLYRTVDGVEIVNDPFPAFPRSESIGASNSLMLIADTSDSHFYYTAGEPGGPWTQAAACSLTGNTVILWAFSEFYIAGGDLISSVWYPYLATTADASVAPIPESLPTITGAERFLGLAHGNDILVAVTDNNRVITKGRLDSSWTLQAENPVGTQEYGGPQTSTLQFAVGKFYWTFSTFTLESVDGVVWVLSDVAGGPGAIIAGPLIDTRTFSTLGMNPAHMIMDSLISQDMQGEPWENINEASFTIAANKLFDEGFGLITTYDHQRETAEQFQERILNVIGGSLSQSRIDGKYRLDLIRGEYELDDLPILSDADILEFEREPSNPNDSVNEVVVEWFDPVKKEQRSTTPIQSLGAIQSAGAVISETAKYPEIPYEDLALRAAARDLKSKSTPLNRFRLTTTRRPFGWRAGTFFRLQVPRRGIGDMVCMVGELNAGTLRSGAMTMVAVQDVTGMPETVYVTPEPGIDTEPDQTPDPVPDQIAFEAPYVELAGALPIAEREAIGVDTGYLIAAAARPDDETNYTLYTRATGEEFAESSVGDWCPTGLVVEAATVDATEIEFTLDDAQDLDRVTVGTAALWGDEICRVDAIEPAYLLLTLARGCGDTVPQDHAAGERIWFYDAWGATDSRIYADGETVQAKFISHTSTQDLPIASAPTSTVVMGGRAMRPYPPGAFRIDGDQAPTAVSGTPVVEWAHRDRLLQADQLVESEAASIGPELTTRYGMRLLDASDTLIIEREDIDGDTATFVLDYTGDVTLELWSITDAGESWQRITRTFAYTPPGGLVVDTITAPVWTPTEIIFDGGGA